MSNQPPDKHITPAEHEKAKALAAKTDLPIIPVQGRAGTEDKVRAFLEQKHAAAAQEETPPETVERATVSLDNPALDPNPEEQFVQSALIDLHKVGISDGEKDLFMKALLTDMPVTFKIELFGGQVVMEFRSRSMHEQQRVLDMIRLDQKEGLLPQDDPAMVFTRLQQYFVAIMLRRFNNDLFSDLEVKTTNTLEQDAPLIRKVFEEKVKPMSHLKWNAVLNGLRTFEEKCRQLSEHCANEDFWKPQGQG